jgi:predicted ATPase/DNA-binding SARP family transcriptional activator
LSSQKVSAINPQREAHFRPEDSLSICLLGGFQILQGEDSFGSERFRLRRASDVIKLLALTPKHRLQRDQLLEWFWPEHDPALSANSLHQVLRSARQVLGALRPPCYLRFEDDFLCLHSEPQPWVDVEAFEAAAAQVCQGQDPSLYQAALALYTGELLPEDRYEGWVIQRRDAIQRTYLDLLQNLARLYEARGEHQPAIATYLRLISADPLLEDAYAGLMRAYALSGQRAQALRHYQFLQETLSKELATEPDPDTRKLYQLILAGDYSPPDSHTQAKSPPILIPEAKLHNLPAYLTRFIGHEGEIAQIKALLEDHRLVTLTGSGGVGKTRLSIQVAERVLEQFPDGTWYVELAPISDPDLVPQIVAVTIGLRAEPNRPLVESLGHFLSHRQSLLVLDNCEHLLKACALLAEALLKKAPKLKILTTSREAMGIAGESAFRVPSLAAPNPRQMPPLAAFQEYEAVRLFVERARDVLPAFEIDAYNAPAIALICQRLDGIPLALELAVARLNLLTIEQLAGRLDHAFRLLTGGSRTALPRQQTLRAAIDWSFQLLSPQEQVLLRRLAVFAGGGSLEAIEAVCAGDGLASEDILDLLTGLVNKSMVNVERVQHQETRYGMLETVRQYAREKLDDVTESQTFYDYHLAYFLNLAEAIEPQLKTSAALDRLQVLDREVGNMRAALSWALDENPGPKIDSGLRLACALLNFWHTQSFHNEGYAWLIKGLSALPGDDPASFKLRARACFAAGHLVFPLGRHLEARQWLQESLEIYKKIEDTSGLVMAQGILGEVFARDGAFEKAKELCEASLAACRTLEDPWLLAWALSRFGMYLRCLGDYSLAQLIFEESLTIYEKIGDQLEVEGGLIMLGLIAQKKGDNSRSHDYFIQALRAAQAKQSKWSLGIALAYLGEVACLLGEYEQAQAYLLESVALHREIGSQHLSWSLLILGITELRQARPRQAALYIKECLQSTENSWEIAGSLAGIAGAALQTNQLRVAALFLGAVKALIEVEIDSSDSIYRKEFDRNWIETQKQLCEEAFAQALADGAAMSIEQAVSLALSISI